jgi:hypothetical protein
MMRLKTVGKTRSIRNYVQREQPSLRGVARSLLRRQYLHFFVLVKQVN